MPANYNFFVLLVWTVYHKKSDINKECVPIFTALFLLNFHCKCHFEGPSLPMNLVPCLSLSTLCILNKILRVIWFLVTYSFFSISTKNLKVSPGLGFIWDLYVTTVFPLTKNYLACNRYTVHIYWMIYGWMN